MGISKYGLLIFLLVVIFSVAGFGGYAGYTVDGVPQAGSLDEGVVESEEVPGILGVVEWVWDSVVFMFDMITFQVDGMPAFINTIFLLVGLLIVFLIVSLIRGVS